MLTPKREINRRKNKQTFFRDNGDLIFVELPNSAEEDEGVDGDFFAPGVSLQCGGHEA